MRHGPPKSGRGREARSSGLAGRGPDAALTLDSMKPPILFAQYASIVCDGIVLLVVAALVTLG